MIYWLELHCGVGLIVFTAKAIFCKLICVRPPHVVCLLLIYCYGDLSAAKSAQGRNEGDENLDRFEAS
jgi:hypothetical protein